VVASGHPLPSRFLLALPDNGILTGCYLTQVTARSKSPEEQGQSTTRLPVTVSCLHYFVFTLFFIFSNLISITELARTLDMSQPEMPRVAGEPNSYDTISFRSGAKKWAGHNPAR
jgi:hypothetical protein